MFINAEKKLFTPGPLVCSQSVKEAMLRDLGSRDGEFINVVKLVRQKLLDIAGKCYILCKILGFLGSRDDGLLDYDAVCFCSWLTKFQ